MLCTGLYNDNLYLFLYQFFYPEADASDLPLQDSLLSKVTLIKRIFSITLNRLITHYN